MKKFCGSITLICFSCIVAWAQPAYDNCSTAFVLNDVADYCSEIAEFTNIGATDSDTPLPSCFPNVNEEDADVWFTFVAEANTVNISVIGETQINGGGSLDNPQFTLYSGICDDLIEEMCSNDSRGDNAISSITNELTIGQTYYIRVDGANARTGSFELCVNNFNQVAAPTSDCSDAVLLCDKSSLSIPFTSGRGRNEDLLGNSCADSGQNPCPVVEDNSVWYKWICDESGTLEFDITPDNPADDLDFMLFELADVNNCDTKQPLRCMFSGEVIGAPFSRWQPCTGTTGLRGSTGDESEFCGCDPGDDNFLDAIDMVEGTAYALVVMNFSGSGAGFSIEFGGTGTFRGPTADFAIDASVLIDESDRTICVNEEIEIIDSSVTEIGRIIDWQWAFGVDSNPGGRDGEGPHRLSYSTAGQKSIALTIEVDAGCTVTEVTEINVLPNPSSTFEISLPDCGGGTNGAITLNPTGGVLPYTFEWQGSGEFVLGQNELENLNEGAYSVVIRDAENCRTALTIDLPEDSIQLNESIVPTIEPSCFGFSDGQLVVEPIRGTAPYEFDFGSGFVLENTLSDLPAGEYSVIVRDANECDSEFSLTISQPDSLALALQSQSISCNGLTDGTIAAEVAGGVGGYIFNWDNGASESDLRELAAGTYILTLQDANGCERIELAEILEPEGIDFELIEVQDATCPGEPSGVVIVQANGGTMPFEYSSNGVNFIASPELGGLLANTYEITVRDSRGCLGTLQATVNEPDAFFVDAGENQTINLGNSTDLQAVTDPPNLNVTYSWSEEEGLDNRAIPNPAAMPFNTTTYTVTIADPTGCVASDSVTVFVNKNREIYVPNAFSPNFDGRNDAFTIFGGRSARQINKLQIFTRWGEVVFETTNIDLNNPTLGWDGTHNNEEMNPGVFAYYAEIEYLDGVVLSYEGDISLLR